VVEGESVQIEIVGGDVVPGSMWLEVLAGEERVASTPVRGRHVRFDRWPLLPGHYRLRLVNGAAGEQVVLSAIEIETLGTSRETGVVRLPHVWN
jgi:hypothetical protein